MQDLMQSLKERKLVQWALAYLAGAWLLMQVVEVLAARWPLPLGLQRGIDLLLVVGFLLAVVLAWYHGEQGRQRVSGPELVMIAVLCTMAASVLAILRADGRPRAPGNEAVARIAVLPFENFSPDPRLAYFAGGLHDRVITQLSTISALNVLPRSSVMQYETRPVPSSQIAEELGVSAVVQGSVRRERDRLNLSVTLIEATSDRQLWSQEFDQQYTAEAAIRAEREIAERVADALGARNTWVQLDILDRKYEDALHRIADEPDAFAPGFPTSEQMTPVAQLAADVYRLMGEAARARALYDSARVVLERRVLAAPGSPALHRNLGSVYATLGQRGKALYHGRLALALVPPEGNHLYGPDNLVNLAVIHAHLGEANEAASYLERVLSAPSLLTVRLLELDPTWDPLRSSPAFVELLEKHGSASASSGSAGSGSRGSEGS